jgi:hypothetical protein
LPMKIKNHDDFPKLDHRAAGEFSNGTSGENYSGNSWPEIGDRVGLKMTYRMFRSAPGDRQGVVGASPIR